MTTCNRCGVSLYYPNNVIGKESVCTNCFRKEKEKTFEDTEQIKETVNQDIKRDLKADLELCNNATPGPWYREKTGANFKGFSSEVIIADTSRYATGNKVYAEPEGGQFPSSDADFIAQAREGWPYAIEQALAEKERADKYEALVRELVYSLKLIRGSSQFSHTTWEEITDLANIALIGAKEVLGDEN